MLNDEIRELLLSRGASLVGFADLREIATDARDDFPYGISIGVALNPQVISGIKTGPTAAYYAEYKRLNALLDSLAGEMVQFINSKGYKAKARPATFEEDEANLTAKLPHKTVATRAGLGWVGKCALLITEEYGSAVRLTTVLTDAPLAGGQPIDSSRCGDCIACVEGCPAHAVTGRNWRAGMPRDSLYDAFACRDTARDLSLKGFGVRITLCGQCIIACPWTQRYVNKAG